MSAANNLKAQLEAATKNLWWSSESDYPIKVVWQPSAAVSAPINEATARQLAGCDQKEPIRVVAIEDFFERATAPKSWHTSVEKAQLAQLKALKDLLLNSLADLQVYRYGEIEITVYIIGTAPDGTVAGVTTTLIET
ncbi:MAG: nuclease A inhibitor family protein [Phormidesmis sp.]